MCKNCMPWPPEASCVVCNNPSPSHTELCNTCSKALCNSPGTDCLRVCRDCNSFHPAPIGRNKSAAFCEECFAEHNEQHLLAEAVS